jgi:poly-gamma-glutamate synthase PgsB/CapB
MAIELLTAGALGLLGLGTLELWSHRRRLLELEHRIHVAGTRGKSSVTRLIAAGMRAGGLKTAAKTTGTLARMILPDAREVQVFRPRGPNVIEQIRIVAAARAMGAESIVLECMALQPALHWVSENKLVRATHAVITNARPDHLDVMGPTADDVARCLCGMIPPKGVLVTGEREPPRRAIIAEACRDRDAELVCVEHEHVAAISDEDMKGFTYFEHKENVALALRLLERLGIDRQTAIEGMWAGPPDPGALTEHVMDFFGREVVFVNAFAANDPQSTSAIWNIMADRYRDVDKVVAVFNLRADRADRTRQLARDTDFWRDADHVVLMGSGAYHFAREASKLGASPERFVYAEHDDIFEVFESIVELCDRRTLVVGLGNIGEQGLALNRLFRNRRVIA